MAVRPGVLIAGGAVLALVPLAICVTLARDRIEGLGLGFVLSAVWLLVLTLAVQIFRGLRVRRRAQAFPGPAGRRHDAAGVAEALVALAPPDWAGLRLEVDDHGRRVTVTRAGGRREPLPTDSPALDAAIDQLDASTGRTAAPFHRLTLAASRDGTARVTVE